MTCTAFFDGRARYTFGMSSTGKDLYIYGAGYQIVSITGHLTHSDPDAESNPPVG